MGPELALTSRQSDRLQAPTDDQWKMQNGIRRSKLELRGSGNDLVVGSKLHSTRPRPGGSAPFRALNPM
eukprot:1244912-Alexandrium_andersonii.AAC.1